MKNRSDFDYNTISISELFQVKLVAHYVAHMTPPGFTQRGESPGQLCSSSCQCVTFLTNEDETDGDSNAGEDEDDATTATDNVLSSNCCAPQTTVSKDEFVAVQQQEQQLQKAANYKLDNISVDTGFYSNKHNLSPSTIAKQLHRSHYSQGVI